MAVSPARPLFLLVRKPWAVPFIKSVDVLLHRAMLLLFWWLRWMHYFLPIRSKFATSILKECASVRRITCLSAKVDDAKCEVSMRVRFPI